MNGSVHKGDLLEPFLILPPHSLGNRLRIYRAVILSSFGGNVKTFSRFFLILFLSRVCHLDENKSKFAIKPLLLRLIA